jgi:Tfp pilus assembly protein PilF
MSRPRLIALLLALATLLVYLPAGTHPFVNYDDDDYITNNPPVKQGLTWAGLRWALTTWHASNWHPLTWVSHMADCSLFGLNAGAHHFVSVLLHAANAALLFLLLFRLTAALWPCAFIAALFAWHPLHVESVAWVAERKDVLSTFFALLSLLSYTRYAKESCRRSFWFAVLFLALGLMAKPMLVTLPFILLLLDHWPLRRTGSESPAALLREKTPFFLLAAAACVVTFLAQHQGAAVATLEKVSLAYRLENLPVAYAGYLSKIFWPANLSVLYPLPKTISGLSIAAALAVLILISAGAWRARKGSPYGIIGWLWFLGMLVPVIGLVQVGDQALADRYTYFSATGIFLAVTFGAVALARQFHVPGALLTAVAAGILAACLALTAHQLRYWRNAETLFRHAIAVTGENETAQLNLGAALESKGDWKDALIHYREALRLNTRSYEAFSNIGKILYEQGQPAAALEYCVQAVQINPGRAALHNNLVLVLAELGRFDEAIQECSLAIQLDPRYASPRFQMGKLLLKKGLGTDSIANLKEALTIEPDNYPMLVYVARVLASDENPQVRNGTEAVALAVRIQRLSPQPQPVALDTMAMAYAEVGNFKLARQLQEQAVNLTDVAGQKEDAAALRNRLERYSQGQPWRESFRITPAPGTK